MSFDEVAIPEGASRMRPLDAEHRIDFTAVLCAKNPIPEVHRVSSGKGEPGKKHADKKQAETKTPEPSAPAYLTHKEIWQAYGADAQSVQVVESFARAHGLEVHEIALERRSIRLSGRAEDVGRAFRTSFAAFDFEGNKSFAPTRPPSLPAKWNGVVETLLGLRGSGHRWRHRTSMVHGRGTPARFGELAEAYSFPQDLDGTGETVGIIEFGGGFYTQDIEQFCSRMGVATPQIAVVEIGNGANQPASQRGIHDFLSVADGTLELSAKAEQSDEFVAAQCTVEVTMDIEIVAALAPGAHLVVYFAPPGEQGLYNAISRAVHDERHRISVLSISWGIPEQSISDEELHSIEGLLREAAHLGITVCASSGDGGALNGSRDGRPSVNYPASSPHCLACGGTSGKMKGSKLSDEVVWNATHYGIKGASGGGVSERFPRPAWQEQARVPLGPEGRSGRGLPDVAGLADPRHGCELLVGGKVCASAGTSAVAPMWAALVARLNQGLGRRCGHLHPHLYRLGGEHLAALRPVLKGNNGVYEAGEGWNACTGYGTPRGNDLLNHLRGARPAQGKAKTEKSRTRSAQG